MISRILFSLLSLFLPFTFFAEEVYPVVIIGGGIGGLTAGIYLSRSGISPLLIEGKSIGGAIAQSPHVQNWPGELEIPGWELIDKVQKQAKANGVQFLSEEVIAVDFSRRPFSFTTQDIFQPEKIRTFKAHSCIIALGSTPNFLNVPGEKDYWLKGVYNCAVCDGSLYKDKVVAVVGGGDAALLEAEHLSQIARKVYILVRSDKFRAIEEKRKQSLLAKSNVEVRFQTKVQAILGDKEHVTHLALNEEELAVDALFLAIGSKPNTDIFRNQVELDERGYVILKKGQEASVEGVYALGDAADREIRQAISAAGDGAKAALQAERYLASSLHSGGSNTFSQDKEEKVIVKELSSIEELTRELQDCNTIVFIDFYAPWCGPCKLFSPLYLHWANEFKGRIKFLKVDVEKSIQLARRFQINSMPTLIILDKDGNLIEKDIGLRDIRTVQTRLEQAKESTASQIINLFKENIK